jgi:hypothetical protein
MDGHEGCRSHVLAAEDVRDRLPRASPPLVVHDNKPTGGGMTTSDQSVIPEWYVDGKKPLSARITPAPEETRCLVTVGMLGQGIRCALKQGHPGRHRHGATFWTNKRTVYSEGDGDA